MTRDLKTPLVENGIVVGTGSDKYASKNPAAKYLLSQFDASIAHLMSSINPSRILEIGCGEGHVTKILLKHSEAKILATDISQTIVDIARSAIPSSRVTFAQHNLYDLQQSHAADLVVCCEVLEHLHSPETGLRCIAEMAAPYALLSVPREPIWRILNFLRGAHVKCLGNSPGHIQHWSRSEFIDFVAQSFDIVEIKTPFPWTMVMAKSKLFHDCNR